MLEALIGEHDPTFEPRIVGQSVARVDRNLEVTGTARFTAEHCSAGYAR